MSEKEESDEARRQSTALDGHPSTLDWGQERATKFRQQSGQFMTNVANNESLCSPTICATLLTIVARGSAIITELHRLIELVPTPYKCRDSNNQEPPPNELICDFSYFKKAESFEANIETNERLKKADEDFCDKFIDTLTRFYLTFESIQRYAADLNHFVVELEEDAFVGQSLDGLLSDHEGRQLLCEAYFLLGYMLLVTDNNFEGGLRERLIVSYYRYSSYKSSPDSSLDDTCSLMRSTGFRSSQQRTAGGGVSGAGAGATHYHRPDSYPEGFFSRVGVNQSIVNLLIAKLQSADIYSQTVAAFPHPDHRSTALSRQASMLYVILYFCPNILNSQRSRMREITDKFFYDNWVISIQLGDLVNLIEAWDPYRAAKESLVQLLDSESTRNLVNQYNVRFCRVAKQLQESLREGWLSEESVLENHVRLLDQTREANVVLRWIMLHSQMQPNWQQLRLARSAHSIVAADQPNRLDLYKFLQSLAELEKRFSAIYDKLLSGKAERICENRDKASEILNELVEIFNDTRPMRWVQVGTNSKLAQLLAESTTNLSLIDFAQPALARNSTIRLINEIESAQESYSDGKNLQVVQLFMGTRACLLQILRALSLTGDVRTLMSSISDFGYAWRIMDDTFTAQMQQIIKDDPLKVYGLKATFLKLASAFDPYLRRMQQVNARADLVSVSQYHSTKLVSYIFDVLHIIPATILELVSSIIAIQTEHVMGDMPSKVPLDSLKEYALADKRFQMLELTYKVSHYAESMLMMDDTTIGLIRINSKQLLEDGIRRELVRRMSDSIQEILQFPDGAGSSGSLSSGGAQSTSQVVAQSLLAKLTRLETVVGGYKRSFEYIQDYLCIYGLRMLQEELSRIVKFNVEQATESLLALESSSDPLSSSSAAGNQSSRSTIDHQQSIYQSSRAPIPIYNSDPLKSSFILRILFEILKITDPQSTIYNEQMSAWYEQRAQHNKVADLKVFELVASSLGVAGLNGIDQVCCTLLMLELQRLDTYLIAAATSGSTQSKGLMEALASVVSLAELQQQQTPTTTTTSSAADNKSGTSGSRRQASAAAVIAPTSSQRVFSVALIKIAPFSERIMSHLLRIGQLQIIRSNLSCVLSTKCRYEARNLYNCLEMLNSGLLSTLRHGKKTTTTTSETFSQQKAGALAHDHEASSSYDSLSGSEYDDNDDDGDDENTSVSGDEDLNLEESQLIFELTNHLDWIGLSDSLSKVYTMSLQQQHQQQQPSRNGGGGSAQPTTTTIHEFRSRLVAMDLAFLILLDRCSKFQFSRSISGLVPKQSRSFYETTHTVDGQPFFQGLATLCNHYQPFLTTTTTAAGGQMAPATPVAASAAPWRRLLERASLFVKCSLDQLGGGTSPSSTGANAAAATADYLTSIGPIKPQDLSLELVNMILSIIEIVRLYRQSPSELLDGTLLPQFIYDTFQFTLCHLKNGSTSGSSTK